MPTPPRHAEPGGAEVLPLVRLSAAAALALPEAQLRAQIDGHPEARWQIQAGEALAQAEQACGRLLQLGVAAERLVLQCRWTAPAELARLRRAGLLWLAWAVQLPPASPAAAAALGAALRQARRLGLRLQLRGQVGQETLAALPALATSLDADELVLAPALQPDQAVAAAALRRCWPVERGDGPRIIASQLWPRCFALPARAYEPPIDAALLAKPAACQGCPVEARCLGIPAVLRQACDASAEPWRGAAAFAGAAAPRPQVGYDRAAIELRGLRLGLREAWRLRVAPVELEAFAAEARADGWALAWSPETYLAHAGGRLRPQAGAAPDAAGEPRAHLVVVARSPEVAAACLADELALLAGEPPEGAAGAVAAVAAMVAAHRRLGRAYGFPSCCVEAFCDAFAEVVYTHREGDNAVAVLRAAARSARFDRRCLTLVAGLGQSNAQPLRHLPCRFDCPASIALAEQLGAAAADPSARDLAVVVWADGAFALLEGRLHGPQGVREVERCQVFGFDPAAAGQSADRRGFAAPLRWRALQVEPGRLRFSPPERSAEVPASALPWAERFPLLLPFAAGAGGA